MISILTNITICLLSLIIGAIAGAVFGGMTCDRTRVLCLFKECMHYSPLICSRRTIIVQSCDDAQEYPPNCEECPFDHDDLDRCITCAENLGYEVTVSPKGKLSFERSIV